MVKYQNLMLYFLHPRHDDRMEMEEWCQSALLQGLQGRLLSLLEDYMYSTGDTRATSLITHVHRFNRDDEGSDTDWNINSKMIRWMIVSMIVIRYPNWVLYFLHRGNMMEQNAHLKWPVTLTPAQWGRCRLMGFCMRIPEKRKLKVLSWTAISRERTSRASRRSGDWGPKQCC